MQMLKCIRVVWYNQRWQSPAYDAWHIRMVLSMEIYLEIFMGL